MGIGLATLLILSFIGSMHFVSSDLTNPTLAVTLKNLVNSINFTSDLDSAYMGLNFGKVNISTFQGMIDSLPTSNWNTIMYWYAVIDKYNVANETTIERALNGANLMANGLPAEATDLNNNPCFLVYDRYLIYGYYWANKYQYEQYKWNMTLAYNSYDSAVEYSQSSSGKPPLWIYGDNTASTYSGRYYDETGQSLDVYLEFYKIGITQALTRAEDLWNFENTNYWNGQYYGYTSAGGLYECEAGSFEQIIWKLYDYNSSIPNVENLLTDINNRYLVNLWNSPQWLDYVIQHANSNPQRRLENAETAWQSIIGTYPLLSFPEQTEIQQLLNGTAYGIVNNNIANIPAWNLLSNPNAGLYDPSTGLYKIHSDSPPSSSASALAANLLMNIGLIETTAKLAVPLEELHYEYTYNIIDKDLYAIDFDTNSIKIPISESGNLTFLYGSTPVNWNFEKTGIWNLTFSQDWNSIVSANYIGGLPSNRMYYPTDITTNINPLNYTFTQIGCPLPINVTVQNGVNNIEIYANQSLVYNNTINVTNDTALITCEIPTTNLAIGNYTLTGNINNNTSNLGIAGITYLGDLNGDFKVNFEDLTIFVSDYIDYYFSNQIYTQAIDYNHDSRINFNDLTLFVYYYVTYNNNLIH